MHGWLADTTFVVHRRQGRQTYQEKIMAKQLSAILAAAAGVALISISASSYAEQGQPFTVNDTGPVLTAQQEEYQAKASQKSEGVAGRPGLAMESTAARSDLAPGIHEVQTPSRGGPIDD
jgi:hypothetical protein